jgi:topoisomerase-4 subunit A
MQVVKVDSKVFVGKGIIHAAVFKKKDSRTIYNMIYFDGKSSYSMIKRFNVISITRNKDYILTKSKEGSKVLYLTSNPNGEAEMITAYLRKSQRLKILKIDFNFAELSIKGKGSVGNILTKNNIKKIELKSEGVSTLSARKIWFDTNVKRLNVENRGELLGNFGPNDKILSINQSGSLELKSYDISTHFDDEMILIEKHNPLKPISVIYFDGQKQNFYVKRFLIDKSFNKISFISDHKDSYLEFVSTDWRPQIEIVYKKEKGKDRKTEIVSLEDFISIKGLKSFGNKLSSNKINNLNPLKPLEYIEEIIAAEIITDNIDIPLTITNNEDSDDNHQTTLEL